MLVLPVLPTYASTASRLETVMATMYDAMMMTLVSAANRTSDMSSEAARLAVVGAKGCVGESEMVLACVLRRMGRHLRTASTEARQGWTWRG
jgi:hypothetical protein